MSGRVQDRVIVVIADAIPLGRLGTPDDIGTAAVSLATLTESEDV